MTSNQKGNVLFLILIAVALFAALSFAVTQSGRTSVDTLSDEKADLLAAEIIGYAAQIEQSVSRMMIINNVPEYGMDVSAAGYSNSSANGTCANDECKLFNTMGGNVSPKLLPAKAWDLQNATMTTVWQGKMLFRIIKIKDVGSELPELTLLYPGINEKVCAAINKRVGVPNDNGVPFLDPQETIGDYSGTLSSFPIISGYGIGNDANAYADKRTLCVKTSANNWYFFHVLIAR